MYIDPDSILPVLTLLVVAYQAYRLYAIDRDLDDLVAKHNEFVDSMADIFDVIMDKSQTPEDKDQDE